MAKARPTAYQYMTDPMLFGQHFVSSSWDSWKTVCKAQFATPAMTPSELAFYRACTGLSEAPTAACRELTLVVRAARW
jgi:hypothetical protein